MNNKIIIYTICGLLLFGLLLLTFFPSIFFGSQDSSGVTKDICQPEPGYTAQKWQEHMGHHPDIYKNCLT